MVAARTALALREYNMTTVNIDEGFLVSGLIKKDYGGMNVSITNPDSDKMLMLHDFLDAENVEHVYAVGKDGAKETISFKRVIWPRIHYYVFTAFKKKREREARNASQFV
jgi:hypothetical protein